VSGPERAWMRPRVLIAALLAVLAVGGVTVWLVTSGSDDSARDSRTGEHPPDRSAATTQPAPRQRGDTGSRPGYHLLPRIEPATIVPDPDPVASPDVLQPIVNGWRAGDHRGITLVEAGLAGDDPSGTKGRFVVFRERERPFAQNIDLVDVRDSGALRITRAPTGKRAGRSAQRDGEIEFTSERGVTGTLHLADDTVTVAR
jgi:hypothetical protein